MSTLGLRSRAEYRGLQRIGMPRALLYYRYGTMWTTFLQEIGCEVITSDKTDKAIATAGDQLSIDECCLASKVYLGHVESLLDRCDAVFVPSVANLGNHLGFCTKFQALPDLVYNTFRDRNPSLVTYLVDVNAEKAKPHDSLIDLGQRFGVSPREAKRAFKTAYKAQLAADDARARAQDQMLATLHTAPASKTPAASTQGTSLRGTRRLRGRTRRGTFAQPGHHGAVRRRDRPGPRAQSQFRFFGNHALDHQPRAHRLDDPPAPAY